MCVRRSDGSAARDRIGLREDRPTGGQEEIVTNRRHFLRTVAGTVAGGCVMGLDLVDGATQSPAARRQVTIGNRRIRVVDIHAHWEMALPEIVKGTPLEKTAPPFVMRSPGPGLAERIAIMDKMGVDVAVISINYYWWNAATDRGLARAICTAHNEGLAKWTRAYPDRLVGPRVGAAPVPRPRRRAAAGRGDAARCARRHRRRPRRRRAGDPAQVRPVLGQGRGTGLARVHAPRRCRQRRQAGVARSGRRRPRHGQHHRQPARNHRLPLAPDLRRHLRQVPRVCGCAERTAAGTCRLTLGGPRWRARGPTPSAFRSAAPANTCGSRCLPTRWCSRRKASGIWWLRWGPVRSCTGPTFRTSGRSPWTWS